MQLGIVLASLLSNPVKTKKEKKRSKQRTKHLGCTWSWMDANPIIQDDHAWIPGVVCWLSHAVEPGVRPINLVVQKWRVKHWYKKWRKLSKTTGFSEEYADVQLNRSDRWSRTIVTSCDRSTFLGLANRFSSGLPASGKDKHNSWPCSLVVSVCCTAQVFSAIICTCGGIRPNLPYKIAARWCLSCYTHVVILTYV